MAGGGTTDLVSDGCSGFAWAEWLFPAARQCCVAHDLGGTDGQLLDCLQSVLPPWAYVVAAFCVALMVLFRPVYRALFKRK